MNRCFLSGFNENTPLISQFYFWSKRVEENRSFYVFKQKTFRLWRYRKIIYSHRFIFFATGMKTRRCPGHIVFRFNHVYSLQQLKWFPEKPRWLQINSSDIPSHTSKGQSDLKQNVAKEVATTHIVPAQLWEEVAPSHQAECPKQSLTYCFW